MIMGRMKKEKMSEAVRIRFPPDECKKLREQFQATTCSTFSEYIRNLVSNNRIIVKYRNESLERFLEIAIDLKNDFQTALACYRQVIWHLCYLLYPKPSQMRAIYGRDVADMLFELPANKVFGQQTGDSAKHISDLLGRVLQERQSIQINRSDTSVSQSAQLEPAVPVSRIAKLSAGEFVGLVADDPDNLVELKAFHGSIIQDNTALATAEAGFGPVPVVRVVTEKEELENFIRIRGEVAFLVDVEIDRMMKSESLAGLIIANKL